MAGGFDAKGIGAGLKVLPFVKTRQLVLSGRHLDPQCKAIIDQGDGYLTHTVATCFMLPDLFGEMIWLQGQECRTYDTRFHILDGVAEIAEAEARITKIAQSPQEAYPQPSGLFRPLTGR